ncbi:MAG: YlxR family protein [Chloroflexi bacterium]|nr:YlxR family protein [Chloroflexota bacterium]
MVPARHVPQRTCIACGRVRPKRELARLVHTPESGVEIDTTGKRAGRGAYLCKAIECWHNGLKGHRLEHTLRTRLSLENREKLIKYGKTIEKPDSNQDNQA